ncbi:MAG: metallophosphoesterase [Flavobacteriales bacterium]
MPISISGAHRFKLREVRVPIPHLPYSFDGLRIVHISDIHAGSFFEKHSVKKGVRKVREQAPDLIFFTGDLVNKATKEIDDHFKALSQLQAPLGTFSILGNHDYGDYVHWPSQGKKRENLLDMVEAHRRLGWELLLNEHKMIHLGDGSMAVLGVENWGEGRFSKYGRLNEAYKGSGDADVKLLLTHDPSHWEARVLPDRPDIDVTFAGHTHGFQFGLELGPFQWSPIPARYDQWAGLYELNGQYLYVNRGFGYMMNVPFRVGIYPEITVMELVRKL